MKYLFLDIDGVLNSVAFTRKNADSWRLNDPRTMLDPDAVALLDGLLTDLDCRVVVSSTWRLHFEVDEIVEALVACGMSPEHRERFVGKTPAKLSAPRGYEVQLWLDEHDVPASDIVVLDDDSDMVHLQHRLVLVDYRVGLTAVDCRRIKALAG